MYIETIFEFLRVQTLLTGGLLEDDARSSKKRSRNEGGDDERDTEAVVSSSGESKKLSVLCIYSNLNVVNPLGGDPKKIYSQHKVRTSMTDRTLDSMFPVVNQATQVAQSSAAVSKAEQTTPTATLEKAREVHESQCFLTSVVSLRARVAKGKHRRKPNCTRKCSYRLVHIVCAELSEILEKNTFVGIVDIHRCLSLIQHSTKLYLVNHDALAYVVVIIVASSS